MITLDKTPLYVRILLPLFWYGIIFSITEMPFAAGSHTRDTISEVILHKDKGDFHALSIADKINVMFRSSAHFFMFGILGILVYYMLKPDFTFNWKIYIISTLLIVGFFGCTDEIHQNFVPGRRPRVEDVMIDCSGALVLVFISLKLRKQFQNISLK